MKKKVIDVSCLLYSLRKQQQPTGIERVLLAYLMAYKEQLQLVFYLKRFGKFVVLPQEVSKYFIELISPWNFAVKRTIRWLVIKYTFLEFLKRSDMNCVFIKICTTGSGSSDYFDALNKLNVNVITMIHDLIPMETAWWTLSKIHKYTQFIHNAIKYSDGIITVSRVERDKLMYYVSANDLVCPPIINSGLASSLCDLVARGPRPVLDPYFIIVGSTKSCRKNHLLILRVWLKLVERLRVNVPKLVILGQVKPIKQSELAILLQHETLQDIVMRLEVDDATLVHYLCHAQALLYPSLAEGYGLPLVEALSFGTPVIANNLPVFYEIAGDVPDYIEATDEQKWLDYIVEYAAVDSRLRRDQLERIKNFVAPTWNEHFERVDKLLENLPANIDPENRSVS